MYRDSFILYHDASGTKIGRPWVNKVYIDYLKEKSMFYMMGSTWWKLFYGTCCSIKIEKNWYFGGVMLSYDLIINNSQVIDQGPSALLFLY